MTTLPSADSSLLNKLRRDSSSPVSVRVQNRNLLALEDMANVSKTKGPHSPGLPQGNARIKGRTSHLKGSWGNKKPIMWIILIKTLGVLAIFDPSGWDWKEDGSQKINISYLM